MKKLHFKLRYLLFLAAVLLFFFLPLPIYIDSPGAAQDVSAYVKVRGKKDHSPGEFMLVYVQQAKATPVSWLLSFADHYATRTSASKEVGDYSDREMAQIEEYYMTSSVAEAKFRALTLAKQKVSRHYIGLYVMSVLKKSSFANKLQVGDVVTKINGKHYESSLAYVNALQQLKSAQSVTVDYLHNNKQKQAKGKLIRLPHTNRVGLGITLTDRVQTTSSIPITAQMQGIGGPSAGLILTLQMYSQLTGQDLLKGRKIVGTGTIEADGSVGQIGGIKQKVVAVNKAHATVFLVPNDPSLKQQNNYQVALKTARELKSKLKIVPVKNVTQAIAYLKN